MARPAAGARAPSRAPSPPAASGTAGRRRRRDARRSSARAPAARPASPSRARSSGSRANAGEPLSSGLGVARLDEKAVDAVGHDVRHAADARRDDGRPGRERLDRADGRSLVHRREHEGVEEPVVAGNVGLIPDEVGRPRDAELVRNLLEPLAVRAVADHAQDRGNASLPRRADDLEDGVGVLHAGHAPDPADDEGVLRESRRGAGSRDRRSRPRAARRAGSRAGSR